MDIICLFYPVLWCWGTHFTCVFVLRNFEGSVKGHQAGVGPQAFVNTACIAASLQKSEVETHV